MRVVGDDTGIVPRGAASRSDALPLPVESGKRPAPEDRRPREPPEGPVGRPGRHLDQTECFAHIDPTDVALRHAGFANQGSDEILRAGAVLLSQADEDLHPCAFDRRRHYRIPHPASRLSLQRQQRGRNLRRIEPLEQWIQQGELRVNAAGRQERCQSLPQRFDAVARAISPGSDGQGREGRDRAEVRQLDRGDEEDGLAAPQLGERGDLVAARERGAEHRIRACLGWCDGAAVPDERRRRAQRIEGIPQGDGTAKRRDDRQAGAADRRERTTRLVPPGHGDDPGAPGAPPQKSSPHRGRPAPHPAGRAPGLSGPSSSHRSRACSTAGGRTSTTGRPRSSAAFASASVTRSSVVKGRSVGRDGSAWWRERQRRLGSGCVPLPVRAILPRMTPGSGLSPNLHHLETSATIAISQEAKRRKAAGEDVIDLGAGEPDFPTPSLPSDAGVRAIREGKTHYPANEGILELRAAAAKHLSLLSGGRPVNADNIVVSNGSKQSLFNVCFTLFGPGEVVAIPAPAWVSYPQIVYLSRARPVLVPGEPEWSLKVSVRDLDRVVPGARGLILCSPCNPTGAVYTQAEIKAIAHWARDRKVWIVADEIYRRIHYGTGPAPSFLDLPDDLLERVVVIYGVSKAYAMTGWRIGLALAPGPVAKAMAALQSHTTTGANHPAQFAAAVALGDDQVERDVARMVAEFRKRRDVVVARFRQELPGVEFVEPLGAFYFFFRVDSFGGITGTEFCTRLVTTTGVALVPGAAFGDDRYVRLSYAAALDNIQKALDRINGFAKKLAD